VPSTFSTFFVVFLKRNPSHPKDQWQLLEKNGFVFQIAQTAVIFCIVCGLIHLPQDNDWSHGDLQRVNPSGITASAHMDGSVFSMDSRGLNHL